MSQRIDSGMKTPNDEPIYYSIEEDGFNVYVGETSEYPTFKQYEPYIPDHNKSYEENAIEMCKRLTIKKATPTDRYLELRADVDYLMLLAE